MSATLKICNGCGAPKPLSEFDVRRKHGKAGQIWVYPKARCRMCYREEAKARMRAVPAERKRGAVRRAVIKKYGSYGARSRAERRAAGILCREEWAKVRADKAAKRLADRTQRMAARQAAVNAERQARKARREALKLTEAEIYRIRWALDPVFYAKERQRLWEKKRRPAPADGTVTMRFMRELRSERWCAYCFAELNGAGHADHVQATSRGGEHSIFNIVPACQRCNIAKGRRSLLSFLMAKGTGTRQARRVNSNPARRLGTWPDSGGR